MYRQKYPRTHRVARTLPILLVLLLVSCGGSNGSGPGPNVDVDPDSDPSANPANSSVSQELLVMRSSLARDLVPAAAEADLMTTADAVSAFGISVLSALTARNDNADNNVVLSPFSVYAALLMAHVGAETDTLNQMSTVLHLSGSREVAYSRFNALSLAVEGRGQLPEDGTLRTVSGLFVDQAYPVLPAFLDTLAINFGAGIMPISTTAPEQAQASRLAVNAWFDTNTGGKFKDVLAPGALDDIAVAITNAVTFKGAWMQKFDANRTKPDDFVLRAGEVKQAEFMSDSFVLRATQGADYDAVELPFSGDDFVMQLVLPHVGQLATVEARLRTNLAFDFLVDAAPEIVQITLPKFRFSATLPAKPLLQELGMVDAFVDVLADFSRIDGTRRLHVSDVIHQAAIAIDEQGAEASAATAVTGLPAKLPQTIDFNRPFYFAIRDVKTGLIAFLGRVMNPT